MLKFRFSLRSALIGVALTNIAFAISIYGTSRVKSKELIKSGRLVEVYNSASGKIDTVIIVPFSSAKELKDHALYLVEQGKMKVEKPQSKPAP